MLSKECLQCAQEYKKAYYESKKNFDERKFCSKKCANDAKRGKKLSLEHKEKIRAKGIGRKHTESSKEKMRGGRCHRWKGGKPKCVECNTQLSNVYAKRCFPCWLKQAKGANASNWKGGLTPEKAAIRNSQEMVVWRQAVFSRDKFTCQMCRQVGGNLHAHHVIPFAVDEEKRFDIDNGQTLCKPCHRIVHTGPDSLKRPLLPDRSTT